MKVIIREAAYDDLDRLYAWIAKDSARAASDGFWKAPDGLASTRTWAIRGGRTARMSG